MTNAPTPLIVVGVPVWRGAEFVGETLRSILTQTGVELRVIISVDGPDEASVAACAPFLDHERVKLVGQPERLGWARNIAALHAAAIAEGADYTCVQPQDDLLEESYLSSLLTAMEASPGVAVAYTDIQCFGRVNGIIRQNSVIGSPLDRQISLLLHHFPAVAFRGLTRVSALRAVGPLSGNPFADFAADTLWMSQMALAGNLLRVPVLLYRKHFHHRNTHSEWKRWPAEQKLAAWRRHCLDVLAEALKAAESPAEGAHLAEAARARLVGTAGVAGPYRRELGALTAEERAQLLHGFDEALRPLR